jgi:DNA-binding MarR family transcriptional regulator
MDTSHPDEDFVARLGRPFTAHRLRRLVELFLEGYGGWLPEIGVTAPARTMSTLLLLETGPLGASEIAARLRFSHPLMINLLASLEKAGFVSLGRDPGDARRRPASLTAKGRSEVERVKQAVRILDSAYAELFAEIGADLEAIATRVEAACRREPFHHRLRRSADRLLCNEEIQCD